MRRSSLCGLIGVLAASIRAAALSQGPGQAPKSPTQEERFARQVIDLTNRERARYNLPALTAQKNLGAAASWMARDLTQNPSFSHTDRQGRNIQERLPAFGYTDWRSIGENIAAGQPTPEKVVDAWMHSPGHRRNILTSSFREIGVGTVDAPGSKFKRYWVEDFGSRAE